MDTIKQFSKLYPGEPVRALSWKQPYASLMLHGKVETRTWNTPYRGWVLICASKVHYKPEDIINISGPEQCVHMSQVLAENGHNLKNPLPLGQAIAVGKLCDSSSMAIWEDGTPGAQVIENKCFVSFNKDLWMHHYDHVQAIQPFPWKGTQGWKTLDQQTIDKIILI